MLAFWKKPGGVMRAIDTNVVIRILTNDDSVQSPKARELINAGPVFLSKTVLLESEWVLRSSYDYDRGKTAATLRDFVNLPSVSVEEPHLVSEALDRAEKGMDFADALHLGSSSHCEVMLTFDRSFIAKASNTTVRVIEP